MTSKNKPEIKVVFTSAQAACVLNALREKATTNHIAAKAFSLIMDEIHKTCRVVKFDGEHYTIKEK
jgi:hypothetical protein